MPLSPCTIVGPTRLSSGVVQVECLAHGWRFEDGPVILREENAPMLCAKDALRAHRRMHRAS